MDKLVNYPTLGRLITHIFVDKFPNWPIDQHLHWGCTIIYGHMVNYPLYLMNNLSTAQLTLLSIEQLPLLPHAHFINLPTDKFIYW